MSISKRKQQQAHQEGTGRSSARSRNYETFRQRSKKEEEERERKGKGKGKKRKRKVRKGKGNEKRNEKGKGKGKEKEGDKKEKDKKKGCDSKEPERNGVNLGFFFPFNSGRFTSLHFDNPSNLATQPVKIKQIDVKSGRKKNTPAKKKKKKWLEKFLPQRNNMSNLPPPVKISKKHPVKILSNR